MCVLVCLSVFAGSSVCTCTGNKRTAGVHLQKAPSCRLLPRSWVLLAHTSGEDAQTRVLAHSCSPFPLYTLDACWRDLKEAETMREVLTGGVGAKACQPGPDACAGPTEPWGGL